MDFNIEDWARRSATGAKPAKVTERAARWRMCSRSPWVAEPLAIARPNGNRTRFQGREAIVDPKTRPKLTRQFIIMILTKKRLGGSR